MATLRALDSGLRGDQHVLSTTSILDGFSSFVLTSTLGCGVVVSVVQVAVYQEAITLLASKIEAFIPDALFDTLLIEMTGVGGLLIVAIGLNLLKITKISVTNLLPII